MLVTDFKDHNIDNFTPGEVEDTGANLADVQLETMIAIQKYRETIRRRVKLAFNGITTGKHKSPLHPGGKAIDSYLLPEDGPIKTLDILKAALKAEFTGIGIYWNGKLYSTHFDLRPNYALWSGIKNFGEKSWDYRSLIVDLTKLRPRR